MLLTLLYRLLRKPASLPEISPQQKYTAIFQPVDRTVHASVRINHQCAEWRKAVVKSPVRIVTTASGSRDYTVFANQLLGSEHAI